MGETCSPRQEHTRRVLHRVLPGDQLDEQRSRPAAVAVGIGQRLHRGRHQPIRELGHAGTAFAALRVASPFSRAASLAR